MDVNLKRMLMLAVLVAFLTALSHHSAETHSGMKFLVFER